MKGHRLQYTIGATLVVLLWGIPAAAQIAFDAATDGGHNSSAGNTHSFSHTTTGSDRFLAVVVVGDVGGGADDISSVTYNSVSMTLAQKCVDTNLARYGYVYTLTNPASGSNTVLITAAATHFLTGGATSYTGVNQTGQPEVITSCNFSNADPDSSLTTSITPTTANSWTVLFGIGFDGGNPQNAGTGSTEREDEGTFGLWGIYDSNAALPASSTNMTFVYTGVGTNPDMAGIIIALAPAGGAAPSAAPRLLLLGVGEP